MSREGSEQYGLLHGLHAKRCGGKEFATCRPLTLPGEPGAPEGHPDSRRLVVVYMAWCGECGAADYEVV